MRYTGARFVCTFLKGQIGYVTGVLGRDVYPLTKRQVGYV